MGYREEKRQILQGAKDSGFQGEDATRTGFGQNFEAGFFATMAEDLSSSQWLNKSAHRAQHKELRRRIDDGEIDAKTVDQFRGSPMGRSRDRRINYDGLGDYLNEKGDNSVLTKESLDENMKRDVELVRSKYQDISNRSGVAGTAGGFIGGMSAGMVADPLTVATGMLVPARAVTAASLLARTGQRAGAGAIEGALVEPFAQMQVANFKEELDVDYGLKQILINSGISIAASGTLAGTMGSLPDAIKSLNTRVADAKKAKIEAEQINDFEVEELADDMVDGTEQVIQEMETSPAKTIDEHDTNTQQAVDSFDTAWDDDSFDPDTWLMDNPDTQRNIDVANEQAEIDIDSELEASLVEPKKARLRRPKRREGESSDSYDERLREAEEGRDARQATFDAEADRANQKLKEEAEARKSELGQSKVEPLEAEPSEAVKRATREMESFLVDDDPDVRKFAQEAIDEIQKSSDKIDKAQKFLDCIS